MAGPINGLGSQQVPLANTFQPGQSSQQVRSDEKNDNTNKTGLAQVNSAENDNKGVQKAESRNIAFSNRNENEDGPKNKRGSLVDITI